MATRPSVAQPPTAQRRFGAGLASGLVCAALFNPWDRALFLSVIESRAFLSPSNFRTPFQGLSQTLVHRTFSNGLYFVLQDVAYDIMSDALNAPRSDSRVVLLAGLGAGAANGALLNSIAAIKYQVALNTLSCGTQLLWIRIGLIFSPNLSIRIVLLFILP
jgi:hypothetical protein